MDALVEALNLPGIVAFFVLIGMGAVAFTWSFAVLFFKQKHIEELIGNLAIKVDTNKDEIKEEFANFITKNSADHGTMHTKIDKVSNEVAELRGKVSKG